MSSKLLIKLSKFVLLSFNKSRTASSASSNVHVFPERRRDGDAVLRAVDVKIVENLPAEVAGAATLRRPAQHPVKALWQHSTMAIDGVRAGVFSPDRSPWPTSFAGLNDGLTNALDELAAVTVEEMSSFVGRDMAFVMGERRMEFTADGFLMSFSKPNFFFHLTTAYAIMRNKGVSVGKMDFLGRLRLKG